ncbi:MAG TPA: hypothetical protein VGP26_10555 [Actinophytocola sp.]|jgi:hypothetical protein|nr:hypothetical protein [Actinophytocola sp.]
MDQPEAERWFAAYLADFVKLGRGDITDPRRILDHYGVPMFVSTADGPMFLTDEAQVLGMAGRQIGGMRAEGYDRTEELISSTNVVNDRCAVHQGRFARLRADGSEIARVEVSYVITVGTAGPRISALLVHSGQ